jgi:ribosomal protein S18 acetylase RimI-like enzyme
VQVDSYRTAYANLLPKEYLDHFTYEEQEQDWRYLISTSSNDILYLAEADSGEVAGYALGRAQGTDDGVYRSELVALHVRAVYQGQGVGHDLVGAMARHLRAAGVPSLMLWVLEGNPARGFYERLGGRLFAEQKVNLGEEEDGFEFTEVAYGWPDMDILCV